ncbi:MAG: hypothetical protein KGI08_02580 [Thaumarchaeota archaeon]|nr:hypothetical protein [Nitrososphaerota archaeon]
MKFDTDRPLLKPRLRHYRQTFGQWGVTVHAEDALQAIAKIIEKVNSWKDGQKRKEDILNYIKRNGIGIPDEVKLRNGFWR